MPLQNRVDPYGALIAVEARGRWMGNRGLLHDEHRTIRRPYRLNAWLICLLRFRDRHRIVMSPGLYTELFFLDEATALAAGHRPCFECRRADAIRFRACAATGLGVAMPRVGDLDGRLGADRMTHDGAKRTYRAAGDSLPDGVMMEQDGAAHLIWNGSAHPWRPSGYDEPVRLAEREVDVLTPRLTVEAIRAGYRPETALADV